MSNSNKLTQKQQLFADKYIECGNAEEAAKYAGYNARGNTTKLLQNTTVAAYIDNKRQKLTEKTEWTVERLINEFATNHTTAQENNDIRASNDSMKEIGKLLGYYKEKVEHSGEVKMPDIIIKK